MAERLIEKLDRLGAEAGIQGMTPEIRRFALLVRADMVAQPEQEPVAYCYVQKGTSVDILTFDDAPDDAVDGTIFPLYTAPPQRSWVGLTDDELVQIGVATGLERAAAQMIESKLKEKNFD